MKKAESNFQSGSYFGYLDAFELAEEVIRVAKKVPDSQQKLLKKEIDNLKNQVNNFLGTYGDFETFDVKRYAPDKLKTFEDLKESQKYKRVNSYDSYVKANTILKECLPKMRLRRSYL